MLRLCYGVIFIHMNTGIRTYIVRTSPETVIAADVGDVFSREGEEFYLVKASNGLSQKLDHTIANFLTAYRHTFYSTAIIQLEFSDEIWIKKSGNGTNQGWVFQSGNISPFVKTLIS